MATYAISMGCVLWRRIKLPETLPPTKWSLGKWGVAVNTIGIGYAIFAFFWAFWPIYWNPTPQEVWDSSQCLFYHADMSSTDELCGCVIRGRYAALSCELPC